MANVIVDEATAARIGEQKEEVTLCTPDGRMIGVFTPLREGTAAEYAWAVSQFTAEEIDEARKSGIGNSSAEIFAELRAKYDT